MHKLSLLPLALCLAAAALLAPAAARACSCMPSTIFNDYNRADATFVARVDSVSRLSPYQLDVQVEVLRAFRGITTGPHVLHTSGDSAACGYPFTAGSSYLVFAYADEDDPGAFWATLCSSTQPVYDVADAERLLVEAGIDPGATEPGPPDGDVPDVDSGDGGESGDTPRIRRWPWVRLDRLDIENSNARTLTDLLWPVPGVFPLRTSRATTGFSVRGLSGRHVRVLLDGFPLTSALTGDGLDPQLGLFDLYALDSVEVVPGLDAATWGAGALGGAVLLSSRRSAHRAEAGGHGDVSLRFDSADLTTDASGRADLGFGHGVGMMFGLHGVFAGDLRPGSPLEDVPTSFRQFGGDGTLASPIGPGYLTARMQVLGQGTTTEEESERLERDSDGRLRAYTSLAWEQEDLGAAARRLELRVGYLMHREERTLSLDREHFDTLHRVLASGRVETPLSRDAGLTWGADLDFERLAAEIVTELPDALEVDPAALDGSTFLAPSAIARLDVQATPTTGLALAGRAGWVRAAAPATDTAGGTELSAFSGSATASLVQTVVPDLLHLHVAGATGTGEPNLTDLASLDRTPEGTFLPNNDLRSEQAAGAEASAWLILEPFQLTVTGHALWLFDTLRRRATGELDPENVDSSGAPLPFFATVNAGQARVYGLESTLTLLLGDLHAWVTAAWVRGDDLETRRSLPAVAPVNGSFGLAFRQPTWGTSVYTRYAADAENTAPGEVATAGHAIFGIRGHYRWAAWGGAVLTIDNLAGQGYRAHGSLVPEPGLQVVGALHFQIGPG